MRHTRRFSALAAIAAILVAIPLATVTPANAAPLSGSIGGLAALSADVAATARPGVAGAHEALARYWTPERMKSALPDSELPAVKGAKARPGGSPARPQGAAQKIGGATPVATPEVIAQGGPGTQAYFPNYPVGHPVARTYGKVFFTASGLNYVCSGTIVNTEGKSTVWTAAHCNTSGQTWHYNWTFVPNYYNGVAPYGNWYAYQLWSTAAFFHDNNDLANDVGAAIMYRDGGWRIADYFGAQGIAWNYPIGYFMNAFGYPQGLPFTGCCLVGEQNYTYDGAGFWAGTIYQTNFMTGGSSGGAWLNWFDGNWGYINGHNDFKFTVLPQYMFSPYYGNQVAGLYGAVRNIST
ncbi:trypsin-like serine peptidase [Allorhizocola rhizosphaerae]|uniref:trypsin-like serine peptidase n=1 Tax=Allorhizocola rhizosphaerae TaxID=1872709 RepID=UPI000E3E37DE|nr:hypothetical protein [Allorhizocola rhizosphaerae]